MSEYKRIRREDAEDKMRVELGEFCRACREHLKEHGDCVDAGTPEAMQCPRVQKEIERMTNGRQKRVMAVC